MSNCWNYFWQQLIGCKIRIQWNYITAVSYIIKQGGRTPSAWPSGEDFPQMVLQLVHHVVGFSDDGRVERPSQQSVTEQGGQDPSECLRARQIGQTIVEKVENKLLLE